MLTTMTLFTPDDRARLAALADLLIPAAEGFPSASQAGIAAEALDQVLAFRPDLEPGLRKVLETARSRPPAASISHLRQHDPAAFAVLTEFVAGAYFLNPHVRALLGYSGQGPQPIDPHPDYLDDGLLQSVIDRGPIYRPTPEKSV